MKWLKGLGIVSVFFGTILISSLAINQIHTPKYVKKNLMKVIQYQERVSHGGYESLDNSNITKGILNSTKNYLLWEVSDSFESIKQTTENHLKYNPNLHFHIEPIKMHIIKEKGVGKKGLATIIGNGRQYIIERKVITRYEPGFTLWLEIDKNSVYFPK